MRHFIVLIMTAASAHANGFANSPFGDTGIRHIQMSVLPAEAPASAPAFEPGTASSEELARYIDGLSFEDADEFYKRLAGVIAARFGEGLRSKVLDEQNGAYADVERMARGFHQAAPSNGHANYFMAEVTRKLIANRERRRYFPESHQYLIAFYRGWDQMGEQPEGLEASVCRERADGRCRQRAGYVAHLLALDSYREALETEDKQVKAGLLLAAHGYARAALKDFPGGFPQFKPSTADLAGLIESELRGAGVRL
jgi:hypothetical protein